MIELLNLDISMSKENAWTIEPWHIRVSLRKMGIYVPDEAIILPKEPITGPDLLKEGKHFYVTVVVNNCERANLKCRIHHWSTDPSDRLPWVHRHWEQASEPLLAESKQ
jgi:large subunit ribosomal protein L9